MQNDDQLGTRSVYKRTHIKPGRSYKRTSIKALDQARPWARCLFPDGNVRVFLGFAPREIGEESTAIA